MKRLALAALALIFAAASGHTQNFAAEDLANRSVERRAIEVVIWGMPAVNYDLMYQAMVRETKGTLQTDCILVAPSRLEKPDAHPQSRLDLHHAVLQHQGCGSDGAGDSRGR
jgi:hypothetical protein